MSSFTRATFVPTGERRAGRALYRLLEDMIFEVGFVGSGIRIVVPAGFVTDGPSIPAWAWKLLPVETMVKSAAVHDMLREDRRFTKMAGDAIFLTAMQVEGTPRLLRETAFLAVRLNRSRKAWNQLTPAVA